MSGFDELIADPQVRRELGGISDMTIWRWDHGITRAPSGWQPPARIGGRKYRTRKMVEDVKAALLKPATNWRETPVAGNQETTKATSV